MAWMLLSSCWIPEPAIQLNTQLMMYSDMYRTTRTTENILVVTPLLGVCWMKTAHLFTFKELTCGKTRQAVFLQQAISLLQTLLR